MINRGLSEDQKGKIAIGVIIAGSQPLPKFKNVEDRFVLEGKMFPVVVDSTNYSNNKCFLILCHLHNMV
jgi:hypothetical protein